MEGAQKQHVRVPRGGRRSVFDRFAEAASRFVSQGAFFTICVVVVVVWMPTIGLFRSVDTWQLVIAAGLADLMEHQSGGDRERLARDIEELRAAVGLERRI